MTIFLFFSTLGSITLLVIIGRVIVSSLRRLPEAEAENAQLKAAAIRAEMHQFQLGVRLQLLNDFKEEYMRGWASEGKLQGLEAFFQELGELKAEGARSAIAMGRVEEMQANIRLHQDQAARMSETSTALQRQRNQALEQNKAMQEKLKQMREELEAERAKAWVDTAKVRPIFIEEPSQNPPKTFPDPSPIPPKSGPEPSRNNPGRENVEIFELEGDTRYDLRDLLGPSGYDGTIGVVNRMDGEVLATFNAKDVQKGTAYVVPNTDIKVIWCALPNCYTLKVTKHIHTQCCSHEHTRQLATYNRRKVQ